MLEVRFELNVNEVIEEIADLGNVDAVTGWEIMDMNLEELSEGKLININEENNCDEKDEGVPDEVTPTENFTFKELSMYQKLKV